CPGSRGRDAGGRGRGAVRGVPPSDPPMGGPLPQRRPGSPGRSIEAPEVLAVAGIRRCGGAGLPVPPGTPAVGTTTATGRAGPPRGESVAAPVFDLPDPAALPAGDRQAPPP